MEVEQFKKTLSHSYPQIKASSINRIDSGWDSWVFDVGDEYIFRVPRRPEIALQHQKEISLLPRLAAHLSTRVPDFEWICPPGVDDPYGFLGYRKIPGVPLHPSMSGLPGVAGGVARFLGELHAFPIEAAMQSGVPGAGVETWQQNYMDFYAWILEHVFPLLDRAVWSYTSRLWEGFLNGEASFYFQPALIHGDLGPEHILCSPESGKLNGVIDWEDAGIGDPALDFTGLWFAGGREFIQKVLACYPRPVEPNFWTRLQFYRDIIPFHEIRFGLTGGGQAHLQKGLQDLTLHASQSPSRKLLRSPGNQ